MMDVLKALLVLLALSQTSTSLQQADAKGRYGQDTCPQKKCGWYGDGTCKSICSPDEDEIKWGNSDCNESEYESEYGPYSSTKSCVCCKPKEIRYACEEEGMRCSDRRGHCRQYVCQSGEEIDHTCYDCMGDDCVCCIPKENSAEVTKIVCEHEGKQCSVGRGRCRPYGDCWSGEEIDYNCHDCVGSACACCVPKEDSAEATTINPQCMEHTECHEDCKKKQLLLEPITGCLFCICKDAKTTTVKPVTTTTRRPVVTRPPWWDYNYYGGEYIGGPGDYIGGPGDYIGGPGDYYGGGVVIDPGMDYSGPVYYDQYGGVIGRAGEKTEEKGEKIEEKGEKTEEKEKLVTKYGGVFGRAGEKTEEKGEKTEEKGEKTEEKGKLVKKTPVSGVKRPKFGKRGDRKRVKRPRGQRIRFPGPWLSKFAQKISTFGPKMSTFGPKMSTFGPKMSTFGPKMSTFGPKMSTFGSKMATFGPKISTFGPKRSTFGPKISTFGPKIAPEPTQKPDGRFLTPKEDLMFL